MIPFYSPIGYNYFKGPFGYNPYYNNQNNIHNPKAYSHSNAEYANFPSEYKDYYSYKNQNKKEQDCYSCSSNNNSNSSNNNMNFDNFFKNFINNCETNSSNSSCSNNINIDNYNNDYFNIFGLKFAFDDLLIIGLILLFYKEDVKDNYLFFALILLLLN